MGEHRTLFFFSSRRRHTRWNCDWSSDVCSSDLVSRRAGKSDPIDARAVALAVVRDGIESFPVAFTDEHAMEIRVLSDYRDQIITERTRMINRLRWHLVTIADRKSVV